MPDKPTTLPKFADEDKVDATSGQNNVVEPENDPHQRFGWDFKEQPPRNFFNWLHRWTYRWIQWLNTSFTRVHSDTKSMILTPLVGNFTSKGTGSAGALASGDLIFDMKWMVINDIIFMIIPPQGVYGQIDTANQSLALSPVGGSFPSDWNWTITRTASIITKEGNFYAPGAIDFYVPPTSWRIVTSGAVLNPNKISADSNKWGTGSDVGLIGQVITMHRSNSVS